MSQQALETARARAERLRGAVYVGAYIVVMTAVIYGLVVPEDVGPDSTGPVDITVVAVQVLFGFALYRWWGFLVAVLPVVVAIPAGTPDVESEFPPFDFWFYFILAAPFLAGSILAGFAARGLVERLKRRAAARAS